MSSSLDPTRSIKERLMRTVKRKPRETDPAIVVEEVAEVEITLAAMEETDLRHPMVREVEQNLTSGGERKELRAITRENLETTIEERTEIELPRKISIPTHGSISSFMVQDLHSIKWLLLLIPRFLQLSIRLSD